MEQKEITNSLLGNRYQLQKTLGSGGMSMVYLARDLMLERPVAVKILKQDFTQNSTFRARFRQEAQAAANLSHPNIVTVHDFGFHRGRLYIVMEYVPGENLKNIIRQCGRFNINDAVNLIVQACAGVGYAHRAGLVHCDIKPHNMLVTPDQRLKVTDFGIARALTSIHPDEQNDVVWGSPQYFSPEQASGLAPSPASDVYSIGVILYEMLTGRLPFEADDPAELARLHREAIPVPPHELNHDIPSSYEQIILKILSKEPSSRYRTADQLGRILSTLNQQPTPAIPPQPRPVMQPQAPYQTQSSQPPLHQPQSYVLTRPLPPDWSTFDKPVSLHPTPLKNQLEGEHTVSSRFDWITIGIGFLAAIAVGGLIPFWLYVWLVTTSQRALP